MNTGHVKVEGINVSYIQNGVAKPPSVVLLHGATFAAKTWGKTGTLQALATNGISAIAINTPHPDRSSSALTPEVWLLEVMNNLKLKNPVFVAPSMAGAYIFPYMGKYPDRVGGLVAVAPTYLGDYKGMFESIKVPVLGIWGSDDKTVPSKYGKSFCQTVKKGKFVLFEGAGHSPYMNDPKKFNQVLVSFLK